PGDGAVVVRARAREPRAPAGAPSVVPTRSALRNDCPQRRGHRRLDPAPGTRFTGHGQGSTPRDTVRKLRAGYFASWFDGDPATTETLAAALSALPDQDRPRADPRYRLASFVRRG
ncbi:hypothetical protein ACWGN5_34575, partial [Streptomyces sp. NPDC055815]